MVEFGLCPKDFWNLEPLDFFILYRQHLRSKEADRRQLLTACRIAGWIPGSMLGDGKRKIKPTDFIKFDWETQSIARRKTAYSRNEKETFLKSMKPEWLPLIDN